MLRAMKIRSVQADYGIYDVKKITHDKIIEAIFGKT